VTSSKRGSAVGADLATRHGFTQVRNFIHRRRPKPSDSPRQKSDETRLQNYKRGTPDLYPRGNDKFLSFLKIRPAVGRAARPPRRHFASTQLFALLCEWQSWRAGHDTRLGARPPTSGAEQTEVAKSTAFDRPLGGQFWRPQGRTQTIVPRRISCGLKAAPSGRGWRRGRCLRLAAHTRHSGRLRKEFGPLPHRRNCGTPWDGDAILQNTCERSYELGIPLH
jgi:hypothetical protein